MKKGYTHVYTGNGKGKTTAALGLAVRAAGVGMKSYIVQFMKDYPYSELNSLDRFEGLIKIVQTGKDDWVFRKELPPEKEKEKAEETLSDVVSSMSKCEFDIYILDEICAAIYFKLINENSVIDLIKSKPEEVELVLTGRYCPDNLIELSDLATEMKEIKHYYRQGVLSRKGIDS